MAPLTDFVRTCPATGLPCQHGCPWASAAPRDRIDAAIWPGDVLCLPSILMQGITNVNTTTRSDAVL